MSCAAPRTQGPHLCTPEICLLLLAQWPHAARSGGCPETRRLTGSPSWGVVPDARRRPWPAQAPRVCVQRTWEGRPSSRWDRSVSPGRGRHSQAPPSFLQVGNSLTSAAQPPGSCPARAQLACPVMPLPRTLRAVSGPAARSTCPARGGKALSPEWGVASAPIHPPLPYISKRCSLPRPLHPQNPPSTAVSLHLPPAR